MEHTEYYQLSLWEQDDRILREDFNSDNAKIDAALASGAKIATGSYTGTGEYGASHPNTLTFDFAPKLIFIKNFVSANPFMFLYPGQTHTGYILSDETSSSMQTTWGEDGKHVSWYHNLNDVFQMNEHTSEYFYFAIG